MVEVGPWLFSGNGYAPVQVPYGARPATVEAPASSPLPIGGEPLQGPLTAPATEDNISNMLKLARERSIVRHEFLRKAMDAMGQLGGELADVDACLEAEGLRLVEEQCKMKVAVNLARHQRELDNAKA